jgi:2-oxo-4-hydroxy-4-carboxy-5-ureidoimidazoline decarboxylase
MPGLTELNALPPADFENLLLGCCAAPGWARRVTEGRPYESLADLLAAADAAWADRDPGDLDAAMAGHPRIGERQLTGWSAQEQAGVQGGVQGGVKGGVQGGVQAGVKGGVRGGVQAGVKGGVRGGVGADTGTLAALADGNAAYEERFGHVFLICATGRGPAEILAELNRRMSHDPATERAVAAAEVGKINALRLRKLATA